MFVTGSKKPIPNLVGQVVKLVKPYAGWDFKDRHSVTVTECLGRNAFGVPMYGCKFDGYMNPYHPTESLTVDFAANEFATEQGEAYQEQHERGFKWLQDVINSKEDEA